MGIAALLIGAAFGHFFNPRPPTASSVRSYIPPPPGTSFPLAAGYSKSVVSQEPDLDNLHGNPRYQTLTQQK
jgi:hypothetical protein